MVQAFRWDSGGSRAIQRLSAAGRGTSYPLGEQIECCSACYRIMTFIRRIAASPSLPSIDTFCQAPILKVSKPFLHG